MRRAKERKLCCGSNNLFLSPVFSCLVFFSFFFFISPSASAVGATFSLSSFALSAATPLASLVCVCFFLLLPLLLSPFLLSLPASFYLQSNNLSTFAWAPRRATLLCCGTFVVRIGMGKGMGMGMEMAKGTSDLSPSTRLVKVGATSSSKLRIRRVGGALG